ncbi:myocardial zonula adherens protein isoform X2 [Hemibagrus wyckioides]|uniref:myocardial zonula adherens protein isoform X2 n=1 Tax=Hemibagrus wyckioides TaxID=337641 RepID=UPI00266B3EA5|nr:myocardial zonula adherens protein isoform X2 [Hemibagrus wyckioides]
MLRNGTGGSSLTTTSTPEHRSERGVRRLRLTLRSDDIPTGQNEKTKSSVLSDGKMVNGSWMRKKNGLMLRERPPGRESPAEEKHSYSVSNGDVAERETLPGLRVFGVVQQEVMARELPTSELRDDMRYIREVRDSLEKVRERMYGQFGGMQQSIQKLSQELRVSNSHKRYLEAEVKSGRAALDSFDQMNSSLISANIDLQKSLLESCQGRVGNREEMKTLRISFEKTEEKLRERERQLAAAHTENRILKQQVETAKEASAQALREMSAKLQQQYDQQLQEQQWKHRQEIEALQAQLEEYMSRLEEAERNMRIVEAKIAERDQRISEVERLLDCMAQEKAHLTQKLCECELRLRSLGEDQLDSGGAKKAEQLQREASELKDRIKHLNDMVFCQQRKVKGMIEEVTTLRAEVARKDVYISELLDRLAIVECEKATENKPITKDIGVGCDFPVSRPDPQPYEAPSYPRPPSRLNQSLLRYTPLQYSSMLTTNTQDTSTSPVENVAPAPSPNHEELTPPTSPYTELSFARSHRPSSRVYTPYMKLMEISSKRKLDQATCSEESFELKK